MEKIISDKKLVSLKYMIFLTIPIFIELLLSLAVGYSDQLMMSKYPTAVTAITNSNTIINMLLMTFTVLSTGSIILITQFKGARDFESEKKIYSISFFLNLFLGILVSIILLLFSRTFFKWIHVPDASYNEAVKYISITGGMIFFQAISIILAAFLKSNSLMTESMIINLIVAVVNIVGNLLLISRFQIVGVALSSTISRILGCVLMFIVMKRKIKVRISLKIFKEFPTKLLKKLLSIGLPSGGEALSYNSSQIIIQMVVNGFGIAVSNTKTYASMFAMVTYMFASAVSQAMQVVIGQLLGSGKTDETNKKIKQTLILSLIVSTTFAVVFYLIAEQAFKIFDITNPDMLKLAKQIMFIEIFLEIGRAVNIVCVRALQTSGDIKFPTILSIIFCWCVAVLGSFIFGDARFLGWGLIGVWISMALDECFRAIIFIFRWKRGKWRTFNLVK